MSNDLIARTCAPTLAGLKAGSIFPAREEEQCLQETVADLDRQLAGKGVRTRLLQRNCRALHLVYLYRERRLAEILADPEIRCFLRKFGYTEFSIPACLDQLERRLTQEEFPHDIGVFLDYPLADIQAFIQNQGRNCPCTGCWKAYTNVPDAQRKFQSFKRCTDLYCRWISRGAELDRLTVAG